MQVNPENQLLNTIKKLEKKIDDLTVQVGKIRRQLFWQRIFGILKIVIIVAPIIIGTFYFIPIFKEIYGQYESLISQTEALNEQADAVRRLLPVGF